MCAINPKHKKRFILDIYTSQEISKEQFDLLVFKAGVAMKIKLHKKGNLRWHVKELKEEAD